MPQMSPLNWMLFLIIMMIINLIMMSLIYFTFTQKLYRDYLVMYKGCLYGMNLMW